MLFACLDISAFRVTAEINNLVESGCVVSWIETFHHVDIHKEPWKYLDFSWDNGDEPKFYMSTCSPAIWVWHCLLQYLFTKLLRPRVKQWRAMRLKAIDDGIFSAKSVAYGILIPLETYRHPCVLCMGVYIVSTGL